MICKTRYNLLAPIRILLPISAASFVLPLAIPSIYNIIYFPIIYFVGAYALFLNFPCIAETLHRRPLYFEDLAVSVKGKQIDVFQNRYSIVMNFLIAVIFTAVAEYAFIKGFEGQSLAQVLGTIGGNFCLFLNIQESVGKKLIDFCYTVKNNRDIEDIFADSGTTIELSEVKTTPPTHARSKSCDDISDIMLGRTI